MASLTFTQFLALPRWNSNYQFSSSLSILQFKHCRLHKEFRLAARRKNVESVVEEPGGSDDESSGVKKKMAKVSKPAASRTKKKTSVDVSVEDSDESVSASLLEVEGAKKTSGRSRKKAVSASLELEEEKSEKKVSRSGRKTRKKDDEVKDQGSALDQSDGEGTFTLEHEEEKSEKKVTRSGRKTRKNDDAVKDQGSAPGQSDGEGTFTLELEEEKSEKKLSHSGRKTRKKDDEVKDQGSAPDQSDGESTFTLEFEEEKSEKKVSHSGRKTRKKDDEVKDHDTSLEQGDGERTFFLEQEEDENEGELDLGKDDEDISCTYGWPPLVCCFGAAQHAFVPSGRPANRLIDHEIHERMKDALWAPEKFVRAPGGSAGSVAVALASLGGKVAFMGKLGDDDFGQTMLYYLNVSNVQTRAVRMDSKKATAVSQMKIAKRGHLRTTCVRTCAEDSLSKSEINIDVLKEAKMFYFTTHSLLDKSMRLSTLRALKISKKLGGVIFYDVNLPLPLWQSGEETKKFIQEAWDLADIIEVTKQELEFLCGIKPTEEFDTKNNARSKFVHYAPEVVEPLWHENLKVLFVTNGTSKIHYYTKDYDGAVSGMEDAPLTPFTRDMSATGDGIVAALMRMLTVQPHLINDKSYLEHSVKYAVNCGVIDQWKLARERGFPPKEDMEEEVEPDLNGIKSLTDKEYHTLATVS